MEDKRDYGLDLLKLIFCISIVWIHTPSNLPTNLYFVIRCFTSIAVPGFYIISGYLLVFLESDVRKIYTKVLPRYISIFLFWGAIYWCVNWFPEHHDLHGFLHYFIENNDGWHLWYLRCLIQMLLFYPLLKAIVENQLLFRMYTVFWFLLVGIRFTFTYLPNSNWQALRLLQIPLFEMDGYMGGTWVGYYPEEVMGLVLIGGMYIQWTKKVEDKTKWTIINAAMFVAGMAIIIGLGIFQYYHDPDNFMYGIVEPMNGYLLVAVCGFAGFILLHYKAGEFGKKFLRVVSPLTLGVYCIHPLVIRVVKKFFDVQGHSYDLWMVLLNVLIAFALIFVIRLVVPKKLRNWIV